MRTPPTAPSASQASDRNLTGIARLTELAVDLPSPAEASPDALRNTLKASIDKWVPAVRAAGVKPE